MQRLQFALRGVRVEGTIVDVETVSLQPTPNGMFTFGRLSGSQIDILQAEDEQDCGRMGEEIRKVWETLPHPIYAYNKSFVGKWISSAVGASVAIDCDIMEPWKAVADQQGLKWPRLRELLRPPLYHFRWGIADYTRERSSSQLRHAIRSATSVNEVVSREATGGAPHIWWQQHLEMMSRAQVQHELKLLTRTSPSAADGKADAGIKAPHSDRVHRLPNGNWSTSRMAAIVCHNMIDLQSQASLLLWQWDTTSAWLD